MNPAEALPVWARQLSAVYESGASNQFILSGNISDDFLVNDEGDHRFTDFEEYLISQLLSPFEVILSYDLGNGLRVLRGGEMVGEWREAADRIAGSRSPRAAMETISHYLRFASNLRKLGGAARQIAVLLRSAHLVAPLLPHGFHYDLNAVALLIREWSRDALLRSHPMATFLLCENRNDLHPLIAGNPDATRVEVPVPEASEIAAGLGILAPDCPTALESFSTDLASLAKRLSGASLKSVRSMVLREEHRQHTIHESDLVTLRKELVEREAEGLIEFLESDRTLDDLSGQAALKQWLRDDIALWHQGDLKAMPMGYLICGPVGTGKTYAVECLAGEAGVPVVKIMNFRDRWVGSTEGNLERIFRLLQALGRCIVFIDEADQALGKRDSGTTDAGLSGRVYSMFAKEMSDRRNRGKVLWVLASSRPDLIEVDLKRPGRVDVKIPLFPTTTPAGSYGLLAALAARFDLILEKERFEEVADVLPLWLTPGAAEALAGKLYRSVRRSGRDSMAVLREILEDYQPPVPQEVLEFQIRIAAREASDVSFIPEALRQYL